jgi:hypothetical protein
MPTILILSGWRFFFFADEGNEPIHVHCKKGDADAKYWFIYDHFDYLVDEWNSFQEHKYG